MKSCQMGAAPETPLMGELSALPAKTPTTRSGVWPRQSVVPVFTAAGRESLSALPSPKAGARAASSHRPIIKIKTKESQFRNIIVKI